MKTNILALLVISLFAFSSCEDVIDVKLSDEELDLYAVDAKITTVENVYVNLYKTLKVNIDEEYPAVSGAVVTVSDDNVPSRSIQLIENSAKPGFYQVPDGQEYKGETGREYTIHIETDDATLIASDILDPVEPIDSIQVHASLRGDFRFLGVYTYGKETPGVGDFYKWEVYIDGELLGGIENLFFASDELVDGNYVEGLEIFTDFHDPENKEEERLLKYGSEILVKQMSLSETTYNFYYQMFDQNNSGGMFSVPPANVKSNFTSSSGKPVLGIFSAHNVSVSNTVLIDDTIENGLNERP